MYFYDRFEGMRELTFMTEPVSWVAATAMEIISSPGRVTLIWTLFLSSLDKWVSFWARRRNAWKKVLLLILWSSATKGNHWLKLLLTFHFSFELTWLQVLFKVQSPFFYLKWIQGEKLFGRKFWKGFLTEELSQLVMQVPQLLIAKSAVMYSIDVDMITLDENQKKSFCNSHFLICKSERNLPHNSHPCPARLLFQGWKSAWLQWSLSSNDGRISRIRSIN